MSYIEKELLIEKIKDYYHKYNRLEKTGDLINEKLDTITDILCEVAAAPTHAIKTTAAETTWTTTLGCCGTISGLKKVYLCGKCYKSVSVDDYNNGKPNYCPHCGAKTKEEA